MEDCYYIWDIGKCMEFRPRGSFQLDDRVVQANGTIFGFVRFPIDSAIDRRLHARLDRWIVLNLERSKRIGAWYYATNI